MPPGEWEFGYRRIRPSSEEAEAKRKRLDKYRRDVARATAMRALGVPPRAYYNHYQCEGCHIAWAEECDYRDDDTNCNNCGTTIEPYDSEALYDDEDETPTNNGD